MYLTIKQHDAFRTLLMGFEIPFRNYIAKKLLTSYPNELLFQSIMMTKRAALTPSSPDYLRSVLPSACSESKLRKTYSKFQTALTSAEEIITEDIEIPMVGALNLITFALTDVYGELYSLFGSYNEYCDRAELYRYARNKLEHPGSRTLEDSHLVPVLSFVKDICIFIDDSCFLQKTREQLLAEVTALQQRRLTIPIPITNFSELPYSDLRIVCRNKEIQQLKTFVYGKPEDLRKQHSLCVYGHGGIGKTALVIETIKQIVCDIQDGITINDYSPKYLLFFSAKKRKLALASETGRVIEQQTKSNFDTAEELKTIILSSLGIDSLRHYKDEGLIIVDNLETLSLEERKKVKVFIETQTPSEMQFILTSRNSEEYELNHKLNGFDSENGREFVKQFCEENALVLSLSDDQIDELLSLARGNTLVLVLSLRRLSKNHSTIAALKEEFYSTNAWKSLKSTLSKTPSNAFEVIGEFMYKDTFEHIEASFAHDIDSFYKVMKVFAVTQGEGIDINTMCLLTNESYSSVEEIIDVLRNLLVIEKKDTQYSLNAFAEGYIINRFLPDAETYNKLSNEITARNRQIIRDLERLKSDMKERPSLAKIMSDWSILTDIDRIAAAKMHRTYYEVQRACKFDSKFKVESALEELVAICDECERLTAHPYIKFQKARILQMVDSRPILQNKHTESIINCFNNAVYSIKTVTQYAGIQQTKSYASLLWLFGLYLHENHRISDSMRYLEEAKASFEEQQINDQEYYQCITGLGHVYLQYYKEDRASRLSYLRKARSICRLVITNKNRLGTAKGFASQLERDLLPYGEY